MGDDKDDKNLDKPIVVRNTTDLQRLKLEKLMKNPDKPVIIPERPKGRAIPVVPDFVRNVMGSSAGAGSGEFHVYRHLRRKEYARQKFIQERSEKEKLNDEYHDKLVENRRIADEKTAKKRAKRQKKKLKAKENRKRPKIERVSQKSESESQSESENEPEEDNHNNIETNTEETKSDTATSENKTKNESTEREFKSDTEISQANKTRENDENNKETDSEETKNETIISENETIVNEIKKRIDVEINEVK